MMWFPPALPLRNRLMSKQVDTWKSAFGDAYIARNDATPALIGEKARVWAQMLRPLAGRMPQTILEVGANIGLNLRALSRVTGASLYAVEPNATARARLVDNAVVPDDHVFDGTAEALPFDDHAFDLVFTSTVLIHVDPNSLLAACREIHRVSRQYVLCNEYFAAKPEMIEYQGQQNLLFKRDFGTFWMDNFGDLELIDYGFHWRKVAAMDNTTWWLFRKSNADIATSVDASPNATT